jgi:hypothetical protein
VLVYYVLGSFPPLGAGSILSGLYYTIQPPGRAAAMPVSASSAGSSFVVFDGAGNVVARGTTVGAPLAAESSTWGAVKALYR